MEYGLFSEIIGLYFFKTLVLVEGEDAFKSSIRLKLTDIPNNVLAYGRPTKVIRLLEVRDFFLNLTRRYFFV